MSSVEKVSNPMRCAASVAIASAVVAILVLSIGWCLENGALFDRLFEQAWQLALLLKLENASFWPLALSASAALATLLWCCCVFFNSDSECPTMSLGGKALVTTCILVFGWLYGVMLLSPDLMMSMSGYQQAMFGVLSLCAFSVAVVTFGILILKVEKLWLWLSC